MNEPGPKGLDDLRSLTCSAIAGALDKNDIPTARRACLALLVLLDDEREDERDDEAFGGLLEVIEDMTSKHKHGLLARAMLDQESPALLGALAEVIGDGVDVSLQRFSRLLGGLVGVPVEGRVLVCKVLNGHRHYRVLAAS